MPPASAHLPIITGLGPTDPAIDVESLGDLLLGTFDKTLFSMITPDVSALLAARPNIDAVVLFGIEVSSPHYQHPLSHVKQSHVCVLQTTLALLALGKHKVYIVADGVSSTNSFEVPIAIARMRQAGAVISTSESVSFELVKDASSPVFKSFSNLVKESKDSTKATGDALLQGKL